LSGTVAANLGEIRERIAAAATAAGRDPAAVTLVVVTKTVPETAIREAVAAGARDLGENRAQELVAKAESLHDGVGDGVDDVVDDVNAGRLRWHFVGRLQRNKVRMLGPHVELWHSIDRPELAVPLARYAPGARVIVEVNLSNEPQKGGCAAGEAPALVDHLRGAGLVVEGLMTVPAAAGDPRPTFAALRGLGEGLALSQLSMGMTADYEAAIAEGATIVRIGSAVFGPRRLDPRNGPGRLRR
jgi:pyridoxal phosphate enzyme (YggS family)